MIWKLEFQRLYLAPLQPTLKNALDLGCGTGAWTREFASTHPSVHVIGLDVSPPKGNTNATVPANCEFRIGNAEGDWFTPDATGIQKTDYVYARMLATAIRDWPALCSRIYSNLQPGGYFESVDTVVELMADDGVDASRMPAMQWFAELQRLVSATGVDTRAMDKQGQWLREAGFDVLLENPIRFYLDPARPEMKGREQISAMTYRSVLDFMSTLTPKLYPDRSPRDLQQIAEAAKNDLTENRSRMGYSTR